MSRFSPFLATLHSALCVCLAGCTFFEPGVPLQVSVSVTPSVTVVGEQATVLVTVTNTSKRERTLVGSGCMTSFGVYDRTGMFVAPHVVCAAASFEVRIPPGGSYIDRTRWSGWTGLEDPEWLDPGEYTVVGFLEEGWSVKRSPEKQIRLLRPS